MIRLKYVGNGTYLRGVPARDLTPGEALTHDEKRLLESGLYVRVKKPRAKPATEADNAS